jgi:hypothetical protein
MPSTVTTPRPVGPNFAAPVDNTPQQMGPVDKLNGDPLDPTTNVRMAIIEVDPAALQRLAHDLHDGAAVAREVQKHHDQLAAHAARAGNPLVVFGATSFLSSWSYGCGCLVADAEGMAQRLRTASAVYGRNDKESARAVGHEQ